MPRRPAGRKWILRDEFTSGRKLLFLVRRANARVSQTGRTVCSQRQFPDGGYGSGSGWLSASSSSSSCLPCERPLRLVRLLERATRPHTASEARASANSTRVLSGRYQLFLPLGQSPSPCHREEGRGGGVVLLVDVFGLKLPLITSRHSTTTVKINSSLFSAGVGASRTGWAGKVACRWRGSLLGGVSTKAEGCGSGSRASQRPHGLTEKDLSPRSCEKFLSLSARYQSQPTSNV